MNITPSPDVITVLAMLHAQPIGGMLTYRALAKGLGREIKRSQEPALRTALKHAEKQGVVFRAIPGTGYKRLNANGAVEISADVIRSVRRKTRKGIRIVDSTKGANDLTPNNRVLASVHKLTYQMTLKVTGKAVHDKVRTYYAEGTVDSNKALDTMQNVVETMMTKELRKS